VTRRLLVVLALAAALIAVCAATWRLAWLRGIDALQQQAAVRADRTVIALGDTLERYESLSYLLASHPVVGEALETGASDAIARANRYLTDANAHAHADVTYIIRADGLCLSASNWDRPDSFAGSQYRFRPYFVDAMGGRVGRFFGIGTVSHVPGYYISQPVYRGGRIVGAAVLKLNLEWFPGTDANEPVFVVDKHGVIYAATNPDGKVYRLERNSSAEASQSPSPKNQGQRAGSQEPTTEAGWKSSVYFDPGTKYIWALALDDAGNLFVATGDHGEIFRITPSGEHSVFFKSDEPHIR